MSNATTSTTRKTVTTITSATSTSKLTTSSVKTTTQSIDSNTSVSSNNSTFIFNTTYVSSSLPIKETDTKFTSQFIAAVAGGSVAAVVLVLLVIFTVVLLVRRRRRKREKSESEHQANGHQAVERKDLEIESYVNIIFKDKQQASMASLDTDPDDPATCSNSQVANKYITNTDTYHVQKDVPVIVTPDKDTWDSSSYGNIGGLQNNESADIRLKKYDLLTVDSEVNNPYDSLRSQTSGMANHYNTFHDFGDNFQERDPKSQEQNMVGETSSVVRKLRNVDFEQRSVSDPSIPVNYSMTSNFLHPGHTIVHQNEYGNHACVEEKIAKMKTTIDKNQRKMADNFHSSLPIKTSADEDDIYRNNIIYNNL